MTIYFYKILRLPTLTILYFNTILNVPQCLLYIEMNNTLYRDSVKFLRVTMTSFYWLVNYITNIDSLVNQQHN